jgi:hypothetical protein
MLRLSVWAYYLKVSYDRNRIQKRNSCYCGSLFSKFIDDTDKILDKFFCEAATATLLSESGKLSIKRPTLALYGAGVVFLCMDKYLYMDGRKVYYFL